MFARRFLGTLLIAHGVAHAGPGVWAAERGSVVFVTLAWLAATSGFYLAGLAILEGRAHPGRLARLVVASTVASVALLSLLGWGPVPVAGAAVSIALASWTIRWARSAHEPHVTELSLTRMSAIEAFRHRGRGRRFAAGAARMALAYLAIVIATRPWHSTWGSTAAERGRPLPSDESMNVPRYRLDHAITIHAPAEAVWPWLVQLGQDRAGFYSYDWLERAFGDRIHNADRIVPEWQHRAPGDLVRATQPDYFGGRFGDALGWRVSRVDSARALVLENWGAFVLHPVDAQTTRLHVRSLGPGNPVIAAIPIAPLGVLLLEPAHFIMERGMLFGIKQRAEAAQRGAAEP